MSKPFEPALRRQHLHLVRDGDEAVIHLQHPDWRQGEVLLTCKDGKLSIVYREDATDFPIRTIDLKSH